jgi:hypothetical protein
MPAFMLDTEKLMASELWALSTGEEFKAAVGLWCRAWAQIPAGSLPDDDRVLAAYSGAGARWKKVKAMAMRGWTKHADGRLYHATVAADVLRALTSQAKRKAEAERLRKWREKRSETQDETQDETGDETQDETRTKRADRTAQDSTAQDSNTIHPPSSPPPDVSPDPKHDGGPAATSQQKYSKKTTKTTAIMPDIPGVAQAVKEQNFQKIVQILGAKGDPPEWAREAAGLTTSDFATILLWRMNTGEAVRWPSGFIEARKQWHALTPEALTEIRESVKRIVTGSTQPPKETP